MDFAGATRPKSGLVRVVMVLDTRWSNKKKKMLVNIIVTVKLYIYIYMLWLYYVNFGRSVHDWLGLFFLMAQLLVALLRLCIHIVWPYCSFFKLYDHMKLLIVIELSLAFCGCCYNQRISRCKFFPFYLFKLLLSFELKVFSNRGSNISTHPGFYVHINQYQLS